MIARIYKISCDYCRVAIGHYFGSVKSAESQAKDDGAIVKNQRHFCDKYCYRDYKKRGPQNG